MRVSVGVAVCAAVMAVSACGSSGSSKSTSGGSPTSAGPTSSAPGGGDTTPTSGGGSGGSGGGAISSDAACKLITQADAKQLFGGVDAHQIPDSVPTSLAKSVCLWSAKPTTLLTYLLQVRMYDRSAFFSGKLPGWSPLSGLGDKASIYLTPGGSSVMISYQVGNNVVSIDYSVHEITSGSRKTAVAQKDELIALVKRAAGG